MRRRTLMAKNGDVFTSSIGTINANCLYGSQVISITSKYNGEDVSWSVQSYSGVSSATKSGNNLNVEWNSNPSKSSSRTGQIILKQSTTNVTLTIGFVQAKYTNQRTWVNGADYLTLTITAKGSLSFTGIGKNRLTAFKVDSGEWYEIPKGNDYDYFANVGEVIQIQGVYTPSSDLGFSLYCDNSSTVRFNISGDVRSVWRAETYNASYSYYSSYCCCAMFAKTNVVDASQMTFITQGLTVSDHGFQNMFNGCRYLANIPQQLPEVYQVWQTNLGSNFESMFQDCTSLTSIPSTLLLSVDGGAEYTCSYMFANCTSLTNVPSDLFQSFNNGSFVPNNFFQGMFNGCTGLTTVPSNLLEPFSSLELSYEIFHIMFQGCTSLTNVPNLPSTMLGVDCYSNMFRGCTSLTTVPSNLLPAATLQYGCYRGMFDSCTSLTNMPSLPATTLADYCYNRMFAYCTSLTSIPNGFLPATTLAANCYYSMFTNCTGLTTVPSNLLPAATLQYDCYCEMFWNCPSLTTAPDLPATTLVIGCYRQMFAGCTHLNYIKAMFTTTPTSSYSGGTYRWVYNVSSTGTFVKNSAATWSVTGNNGIPSGWTVQTASS